jgi:hypothetical protein
MSQPCPMLAQACLVPDLAALSEEDENKVLAGDWSAVQHWHLSPFRAHKLPPDNRPLSAEEAGAAHAVPRDVTAQAGPAEDQEASLAWLDTWCEDEDDAGGDVQAHAAGAQNAGSGSGAADSSGGGVASDVADDTAWLNAFVCGDAGG